MALIKLAALGIAGYALYRYSNRNAEPELAHPGYTPVRDAGPEHMTSAPPRWSKTDEAIDESFPASDPPSTY